MLKQQSAVENFKNVMRYMGDMPLHRNRNVSGGHHDLSNDIVDNLERDALRSKMVQLGFTHDASSRAESGDNLYPSCNTGSMVDEIWCQLMKQIPIIHAMKAKLRDGNSSTIASVFKPSVELFPCVFQFVHDHCFETDEIGALAVYSPQFMMKREAEVVTPRRGIR